MTTARKQLISVEATPYYHCVSRCVRQSYLCGRDKKKNISYEHRKSWIEKRLKLLSQVYCINLCSYAIMSNHYHVVVHINLEQLESLSNIEVIERWARLHKLPSLIARWCQQLITTQHEENQCLEIISLWRERLCSLSWYMKEINFYIACRANQEDGCKGHFWESRFKSQALLDEKALAAAMAYVDLNPVRAGIAKTPESSDFTSIQIRLKALQNKLPNPSFLHPFQPTNKQNTQYSIPFDIFDYINLVDWSARQFRGNKGSIPDNVPPILDRLSFNQKNWLTVCSELEKTNITAIGAPVTIEPAKRALGKAKIHAYKLD